MHKSKKEKRFERLLAQFIAYEINENEISELVGLIEGNEAFYEEVRRQLETDERLSHLLDASRSDKLFIDQLTATLEAEDESYQFVQNVVQMAVEDERKRRIHPLPWIISTLSAAACLTIATLWFTAIPTSNEATDIDKGIAVITTLLGQIHQDDELRVEGDTLTPGRIEVPSGFIELEFYSGARVSVAGPAKLELKSRMQLTCLEGRVRAFVPPVAHGFTIETPQSDIVDLGTEFGVEVAADGHTEIHVFDGEVETYDSHQTTSSKRNLTAGKAIKISEKGTWKNSKSEDERFQDLTRIYDLDTIRIGEKLERWKGLNRQLKENKSLIAYYDFEPESMPERTLKNKAPTGDSFDGAIVGATWTDGPWPGKHALTFKRPGDQVRVNITGEYKELTLAAWIRVDGLDRSHNSLLLTDEYDPGEVHWQFKRDGSLLAGIRYDETKKKDYSSEAFVNLQRLGHWVHLATIINSNQQTVSHFLNGKQLCQKQMNQKIGLRFGPSSIGNWGKPIGDSPHQIRNLNGQMAELMIFNKALALEEIEKLALQE